MNDPLTTIDAEQLEQNVNNAFKTIFKCVKHFKEIPACQEVAMEVKLKIENFKPYIPLIQGLRNPGMRSRHWEQVSFLAIYRILFVRTEVHHLSLPEFIVCYYEIQKIRKVASAFS